MEHGADANVVALNVANNPEIRPIEDALDEPLVQLHLFPLIPGYVDDVIYPENRPIRNQDQGTTEFDFKVGFRSYCMSR